MTSTDVLIIINLFVLESLLSVDNAAVLAVMVKDLPKQQKKKALRYGMIGAYAFRGLCLATASWLVSFMWLKIAGGLYLVWLAAKHFLITENEKSPKDKQIMTVFQRIGLNTFWATVALVEVMDLAFSIDNVFAAVALSDNIFIIMTGVFIGILAMRFVAGWFVNIMGKYKSLEHSAYIMILLLGAKLVVSGLLDYTPFFSNLKHTMETHTFDLIFSFCMMAIFFIPLIKKINPVSQRGSQLE